MQYSVEWLTSVVFFEYHWVYIMRVLQWFHTNIVMVFEKFFLCVFVILFQGLRICVPSKIIDTMYIYPSFSVVSGWYWPQIVIRIYKESLSSCNSCQVWIFDLCLNSFDIGQVGSCILKFMLYVSRSRGLCDLVVGISNSLCGYDCWVKLEIVSSGQQL